MLPLRLSFLCTMLLVLTPVIPVAAAEPDVVVYGGSAGGVAAAVQVARMGKPVVLIEPGRHIGGLTSGGLGWTDSGNKAVIGGIAREFYQRIKRHYDQPTAWIHEKPEDYKYYRPSDDAMWTFEPKVAEAILRDMLNEHAVEIVFGERLDRAPGKGVRFDGNRIASITMQSGKSFSGKIFIDATYEGDLMAAAAVSYTVGREANEKYGETMNGVARKWQKHNHRFLKPVDPFITPGDPQSGLLFGIEQQLPPDGSGDHRVQAYCFRMCMSNVAANRVPFHKPAGYDERKYELLFRNFEAGDQRFPMKIDRMPNGKTDTNNNGAVSTDFIGQNYKYPEASYAEREAIIREHLTYQQGLMWTLANHPRVPPQIREQMKPWGLAMDEFTDTNHWPHQLYIREARRMVSDYVQTEQDCRRLRETPHSIGMGSYNMDSHNCARYVTPQGTVQNEGDVQESPGGPYRISYQAIVPKKGECSNLLVPICLSSSHIAYGSIRMEPVFMILGQSAATAAVIAIEKQVDVQAVPYEALRARLLADKQVLDYAMPSKVGAIDPKQMKGIVVDDDAAERIGFEFRSNSVGPYYGNGYRHDGAMNLGKQSARFTPDLPSAGRYEVRLVYSSHANRATNVPVQVIHADGTTRLQINQRKPPPMQQAWISLGRFNFAQGRSGSVVIRNEGTDGYVIIDAVEWLPVPE